MISTALLTVWFIKLLPERLQSPVHLNCGGHNKIALYRLLELPSQKLGDLFFIQFSIPYEQTKLFKQSAFQFIYFSIWHFSVVVTTTLFFFLFLFLNCLLETVPGREEA